MSNRGRYYIDYSRVTESWGAIGDAPAFERRGNVARVYGGGTIAGRRSLVDTLRAEGVDDFGGTDVADIASTG